MRAARPDSRAERVVLHGVRSEDRHRRSRWLVVVTWRNGVKVSVIYASLKGFNPGMISVNEAFGSWLRNVDLPVEAEHYALGVRAEFDGALRPQELHGNLDRALDAERVLFWGDWLQTTRFHESIVRGFPNGFDPATTASGVTATEQVRRHLILSGQPDDVLQRVGIVGSTTALNSAQDFLDDAYQHDLERLFGQAAFVLMRDPISVVHAQAIRTATGDACQGFDCAFLLDAPALIGDAEPPTSRPYVATYFGRNLATLGHEAFAQALAGAAGAEVMALPWLKGRANRPGQPRRTFQRAWHKLLRVGPKHASGPGYTPLDELLAAVRGARFVVTDTYHLAVNAWNLGVPAVMVADVCEDKPFSVNSGARFAWRDKRYELYSEIEALHLFVRTSELAEPRHRRAHLEHLGDLLTSRGRTVVTLMHERVARLRANFDARLRRELGATTMGRRLEPALRVDVLAPGV